MVADANEGSGVSRRAFLHGMVAAGVVSAEQKMPALRWIRRPAFGRISFTSIPTIPGDTYHLTASQSLPRTCNDSRRKASCSAKRSVLRPPVPPAGLPCLPDSIPTAAACSDSPIAAFRLNDYQQHIVHTLKPAGYTSVLAGLQHVAKVPETIGYDQVLPHKDTSAVHVAPAAVGFLDSRPTLSRSFSISGSLRRIVSIRRPHLKIRPTTRLCRGLSRIPRQPGATSRATGRAPGSWTKASERFSKRSTEMAIVKTR